MDIAKQASAKTESIASSESGSRSRGLAFVVKPDSISLKDLIEKEVVTLKVYNIHANPIEFNIRTNFDSNMYMVSKPKGIIHANSAVTIDVTILSYKAVEDLKRKQHKFLVEVSHNESIGRRIIVVKDDAKDATPRSARKLVRQNSDTSSTSHRSLRPRVVALEKQTNDGSNFRLAVIVVTLLFMYLLSSLESHPTIRLWISFFSGMVFLQLMQ